MLMDVTFPGGAAVDAHYKGHTIHTDQPERAGGQDSGPAPFDLFLASIATCGGFYAARFCEERGIATDGLGLTLEPVRAPDAHRISSVRLRLRLPEGFPERYRQAIVRAIDQCAVKRHLVEPPDVETEIVD